MVQLKLVAVINRSLSTHLNFVGQSVAVMDHGSEEETESQGHTRWSMPRLPYLDQIQIGAEGLLLDDASRIHSLQPPSDRSRVLLLRLPLVSLAFPPP